MSFNQERKQVYVMVGFTEGNWHVRRFNRGLRQHGFAITQDVTQADYVIAHSGGCYTVPPLANNQILMLINPTYWPGRSVAMRSLTMTGQLIRAVKPGNQPFYHLWKTAHNIFYLVYHYRLNWVMTQRSKEYSLEQAINHPRTILVRNDNDPWLTPDLDNLQKLHPSLSIIRLPGDHDDCWLHPMPYIELLGEYA